MFEPGGRVRGPAPGRRAQRMPTARRGLPRIHPQNRQCASYEMGSSPRSPEARLLFLRCGGFDAEVLEGVAELDLLLKVLALQRDDLAADAVGVLGELREALFLFEA